MIKNTPLRVDCLLMLRTQKTRILHLNQYHAHKRHGFFYGLNTDIGLEFGEEAIVNVTRWFGCRV